MPSWAAAPRLTREKLCPIGPKLSLRSDEAVERLACDAQFFAEISDPGVALGHGRLREPDLGQRHRVGPPAMATTSPRGGKAGKSSLSGQLAFELGERSEDAEHQAAARRCGVDAGTLAGEHAETNLLLHQIMDGIDEVPEVATEAVELPDDQCVSLTQRLEARVETRAIVLLARGLIFIKPSRRHACGKQCVLLQVKHLRSIGLRDPHVADQHTVPRVIYTVDFVITTFCDNDDCRMTARQINHTTRHLKYGWQTVMSND
jgi:hypothetical protein